jgi:hypothetical protein
VALHFSRRPKPSIDFIEVFPGAPVLTVEDELDTQAMLWDERGQLAESVE